MHVKNIRAVSSFLTKIKLFWDRVTLTRTTTVYFVFSVLHCVVQVIFQVQAFRINAQATDFLVSIAEQGDALNSDGFYVVGNGLRLCNSVPTPFNTSSCQVIWNGAIVNNTLESTSAVAKNIQADPSSTTTITGASTISAKSSRLTAVSVSSSSTRGSASCYPNPTPTPMLATDTKGGNQGERIISDGAVVQRRFSDVTEAVEINGTAQVVVNGLGWNNESAILGKECLWALGWPIQVLQTTKREDFTFIMFQIWVLGMSVVAILNESVPHTVASLLTHLVATGWAGFQIFNTAQFRKNFAEVTTNGACHPINLLPRYWNTRSAAEIPSLALNAVALLISTFLSWRLAKSFNWQTFKRIGASLTICRIYKIVLTLSIIIQLSLFFIVTSIALWLDQLCNGAVGRLATSPVYRPLLGITLLLLPPWLAAGWYSARREQKIWMFVFLLMCLGYLAGWGTMFNSTTFRWTFMTWTFFGVVTTVSVILTLLSFILGIICRFNFGKGLPYYLNAQEPIGDDSKPAATSDPEKVAFPSSNRPTFSTIFDPGAQASTSPQKPIGMHSEPMKSFLQQYPDENRLIIE